LNIAFLRDGPERGEAHDVPNHPAGRIRSGDVLIPCLEKSFAQQHSNLNKGSTNFAGSEFEHRVPRDGPEGAGHTMCRVILLGESFFPAAFEPGVRFD
jgi:hypothetical protein